MTETTVTINIKRDDAGSGVWIKQEGHLYSRDVLDSIAEATQQAIRKDDQRKNPVGFTRS